MSPEDLWRNCTVSLDAGGGGRGGGKSLGTLCVISIAGKDWWLLMPLRLSCCWFW